MRNVVNQKYELIQAMGDLYRYALSSYGAWLSSNEGSCEPAQMCRLGRTVAAPMHNVWKKTGQTLDFLSRWVRQNGCLKEGLAHVRYVARTHHTLHVAPGADPGFPGFLEGGGVQMCRGGGSHCCFYLVFLKYPPHKNEII